MPLNVSKPARHVAMIEIDNQAKMNALSRTMFEEIGALWDRFDADDDCRAIVLTASGERAFCAGADIGGDLSAGPEIAAMVGKGLLKTHAISKPVVAAVNGVCAGGGVELMLAADIRIAASHARFGLPEVKWSIYPFGGAVTKLFRQIGYVHAADLLLTARMIDAAEAAEINLVNRVADGADDARADAIATAAAIAGNSPPAVQAVKRHLAEIFAEESISRDGREQALGDEVRLSDAFQEGVSAFREKRSPDYR